ncbi:MAG: metal-sensing transcriptional repressor [bacterium]
MLESYKQSVTMNIKKASGTLEKVKEMLDKDTYCMDVAQQINAAIGLLRQANNMIVESHLHTCGHRMASSDPKKKKEFIKEILQVCAVSTRKK